MPLPLQNPNKITHIPSQAMLPLIKALVSLEELGSTELNAFNELKDFETLLSQFITSQNVAMLI